MAKPVLRLPAGWTGYTVHFKETTSYSLGYGESVTVHEWTLTRPGDVVTVFRRIHSHKSNLVTGWECKRPGLRDHHGDRPTLAGALEAMDRRFFLCGHSVPRADPWKGGDPCPHCNPREWEA